MECCDERRSKTNGKGKVFRGHEVQGILILTGYRVHSPRYIVRQRSKITN